MPDFFYNLLITSTPLLLTIISHMCRSTDLQADNFALVDCNTAKEIDT